MESSSFSVLGALLSIDQRVLLALWGLLVLLVVVIHVAFAIGVHLMSSERSRRGLRSEIVPGMIWSLATLLGGVFVAGVYWFVHHMPTRDEVEPA